MVLFLSLAGLWCLAALASRRPFPPGLISTLILAEALIVVQGVVGVVLWAAGGRAAQWEHWLYGLTAALSLPGAWVYARRHRDPGRLFLLAVTCFWIVALSLRGFTTGR